MSQTDKDINKCADCGSLFVGSIFCISCGSTKYDVVSNDLPFKNFEYETD